MRIVSFDAFRSLNVPGVHYIKPAHFLDHAELIRGADWVLFPEYWQANSIYYGLNRRIFPAIAAYHLGYTKVEMTRALQTVCPANLPVTAISANTPEQAESLCAQFPFPFVAKNIRSSEGRGVYLVRNGREWRRYCREQEVLYVQEYLPIDRDLRLVVVGRHVVAGYWRVREAAEFHNNLAAGGRLDFSPLPPAAVELVTTVARRLGIDYAGFDVAMLQGRPYIFEFNRLFGNRGLAEQGVKLGPFILDYLNDDQTRAAG